MKKKEWFWASHKISKELSSHRLEQAKENIEEAELLYNGKKYKGANNRAYYAIFHAINAIHALDGRAYKRHKDAISNFNKDYVKTEIFPRQMGRRIARANQVREDSDYDDEFVVDPDNTLVQIETAEELIKLVKEYIKNKKENYVYQILDEPIYELKNTSNEINETLDCTNVLSIFDEGHVEVK